MNVHALCEECSRDSEFRVSPSDPALDLGHVGGRVRVAYGIWCAIRRCSSATRQCGASGTGNVSLRGLIGSSPVTST
eukprot:3766414-Prymnesium_polylepis.1